MRIFGGQVLVGGEFTETSVDVDADSGSIAAVGASGANGRGFDARGLYVMPGIVDIHGDAFERQLMPRPGVSFPIDVALIDSDRQAIANGITTLYHGVTWSWEPGLRGADNARAILAAIETQRGRLLADTRLHLRYEVYNFDAEAEVSRWLAARRIGLLGFNDHMPAEDIAARVQKLSQMVDRSGITRDEFLALVVRLRARADDVQPGITRLAAVARANGIPLLSHDDMSPAQRGWFRARDCRLSEFPTTAETAQDAADHGDDIVLGAPNVVRGGSHIGWIGAADMIARGCCTILASDYYYPAPLLAAFRLAADGIKALPQAWTYVSEQPARAAGLDDRGVIAPGRRADLVIVDGTDARRPRVVATMSCGRMTMFDGAGRMM